MNIRNDTIQKRNMNGIYEIPKLPPLKDAEGYCLKTIDLDCIAKHRQFFK